jgi:hypothetical protein
MPLTERFTLLVKSANSIERKNASALLARNTDILSDFIADIFPLFLRLLADTTSEVTENATRYSGVIAAALIQADAISGYAEVFDRTLFAIICEKIFSHRSRISAQVLLETFRTFSLHMRASERSERLFRVLAPAFLSDEVAAKVGALSLVPVVTEFFSEPEIRGFLVPLVMSTASDAQYLVRKSSIPVMGVLAKYFKSFDVFTGLCADPQRSVRVEVANHLHLLGPYLINDHEKILVECMKQLLNDASVVVAREATFNVVRWIALWRGRSTKVPVELVNEFKDVFNLFVSSNPYEPAICLAESFDGALEVLGPERVDEELFMNAVAVFNRTFDIQSQRALAKALPVVLSVVGVEHTYALLDMYIKTHRDCDVFAAALDSLLEVLPKMPDNLALRLLVSLSLQPKRHAGAWRRRMLLAERIVDLAEACCKTFSESNFLIDAVRHVLVPLWTRLLADPANAVREAVCQSSGKLFEILFAGNTEYRESFLDHIWFVFGKSETATRRQVFIRFAVALVDARVKDHDMLDRLASLQADKVTIVRICFEVCRAADHIKDAKMSRVSGEQTVRVRRPSEVGWIFGEEDEELDLSSDFLSDRSSTPPAHYVEVGEALDAWTVGTNDS